VESELLETRTERIEGLHCVTLGHGDPIVVLHAGPGLDHQLYRPWLDPVARRWQLVYLDFRGNGRSERPADWTAISPDSMVEDIESVRRHLGFERLILLGHCGSCTIALMYFRRHPERVKGLVLCAGAPAMDFSDHVAPVIAERATPDQLAALARLYTDAYPSDSAFRDDIMLALPLYFHRMGPGVEDRIATSVRFSGRAWTSFRDHHLATFSCLDWLHEVDAPALVLSGRHDVPFPVEHCAGRMAQLLPNARLELLEASGHMPFIEEPDTFVSMIEHFITGLAAD
jgi:proline iminopeptidase